MAIAVDVRHRHRGGASLHGEAQLLLEGAITVTQQQRYVVRVDIGHDEIEATITVDVRHHHRGGGMPNGKFLPWIEEHWCQDWLTYGVGDHSVRWVVLRPYWDVDSQLC